MSNSRINSYRDCFFANNGSGNNNDNDNNSTNNDKTEEEIKVNSMLWFKKYWFSEMASIEHIH